MPTEELVAIEVSPHPDSLSTIQSSMQLESGYNVWQYGAPLQTHDAAVNPDGRTIILAGKRYENGISEPLADSLTACTFGSESVGWICAATVSDSVHVSGNALHVAAARTYVLSVSESGGAPSILMADSARFVSSERYVVTRYDRPVVSGETVAVVRSRQTRQVVVDSSGAVVNDILYAADVDVLRFTSGAQEAFGGNFLTASGSRPWISIEGDRIAIEQNGVVWTEHGQFYGDYPQFAAGYVVTRRPYTGDDPGGIDLFDPETGSSRRIVDGSVDFFTARGDRIYYVAANSVRRYDISEGTDVRVFVASDYDTHRAAGESIWVSTQIYSVEPLVDGQLMVFAVSSWSYQYDDGC